MYTIVKNVGVWVALVAAAVVFPVALNAADLKIDILNVKNDHGTVIVSLWESPDGFLDGASPARLQKIDAKSGNLNFVFKDLKSGVYAVSLYHDENKNDDLDSNLVGMPTEGYGFSNDVRGMFGPPSFQNAAFQIANEDVKVNISMIY